MQAIRFFETLPEYTALNPKKIKILIDGGPQIFYKNIGAFWTFYIPEKRHEATSLQRVYERCTPGFEHRCS
jgi:hypothetical protein